MKRVRKRAVVSGRVQGVAFRAYTRSMARKLGVVGWVRNLPNGKVEALMEGAEPDVAALAQWLQKGPSSAQVSEVSVYDEKATGEFNDFDVTYVKGVW